MQTETATLADTARKALEEHEAAVTALIRQSEQLRRDDAQTCVRAALAPILAPQDENAVQAGRDYETVHLDADQRGGFDATVHADGLTFTIHRHDWNTPADVTLVAACPDCHEPREYGSHIHHLHELGAALRSSEQPCHVCMGGSLTVKPEPAWRIDRFTSENEAAHVAEQWENAGYEIRLYHGGDTIVVAGHKYQAPSETF